MKSLAGDTIELRLPSKPEYVMIVRSLITDMALRTRLSADDIEDVRVAVSEVCANVVRHAYVDRDGDQEEMVVRVGIDGDSLIMEVADTGRGCFNQCLPARHTDRIGGFGLFLVKNLVDQFTLNTSPDQGTTVRMVKRSEVSV